MKNLKGLSLGWVLVLTACSPVMPGPPADRDVTTSVGSSESGGTPGVGASGAMVGAPGPVAGVGLPILAMVGGVIWIKFRKRRRDRLQK
jgi:hypothetical protein